MIAMMIESDESIDSGEVVDAEVDRPGDTRFKNQSAIITEDALKSPIYIIGAGAIGSFVALTLAKMGFGNITVRDMDIVDVHNIPTQFYPEDAVGRSKVDALYDMVLAMSGVKIKREAEAWTTDIYAPKGTQVVVVAVDDMDLRKWIWDYWSDEVPYIVEARMGAEVARIYAVNTADSTECAFYESTLYPQSEAAPDRCAAKSIIYTVLGCASIISATVKRVAMSQRYPTEVIYDFVTHTQTSFKAKAVKHEEVPILDAALT